MLAQVLQRLKNGIRNDVRFTAQSFIPAALYLAPQKEINRGSFERNVGNSKWRIAWIELDYYWVRCELRQIDSLNPGFGLPVNFDLNLRRRLITEIYIREDETSVRAGYSLSSITG